MAKMVVANFRCPMQLLVIAKKGRAKLGLAMLTGVNISPLLPNTRENSFQCQERVIKLLDMSQKVMALDF